MVSLRYLWIVEGHDGKIRYAISVGKRGPKPDQDGFMILNKKKYAVDPRKYRRWDFDQKSYKRFRLYRRKIRYFVQYWKENDPSPLDFFHVKYPDPKFTSQMLATMSKAKRIDKLIANQEIDIVKIALILSLIINIGVVAWLISQMPGLK